MLKSADITASGLTLKFRVRLLKNSPYIGRTIDSVDLSSTLQVQCSYYATHEWILHHTMHSVNHPVVSAYYTVLKISLAASLLNLVLWIFDRGSSRSDERGTETGNNGTRSCIWRVGYSLQLYSYRICPRSVVLYNHKLYSSEQSLISLRRRIGRVPWQFYAHESNASH